MVTKKSKKDTGQTILVWILGIIVLQFLVVGGLLFTISSTDSEISEINNRVTRIDSFFASNAPGYGSGTTAPAPTGNSGHDYGNSGSGSTHAVDLSSINIDGEPQHGNPDAKVTVFEYSDYECPFCGKFYSESYKKLKEEYIDTGKINFVYKDFPLGFHAKAVPVAAAANCVLRDLGNDKYFEMHDKIFENQNSMSDSNYKKWALELGMDSDSYDSCIVDSEILDEINGDLAEGSQLGVSGTPSFFINGNLIVGAQPYSVIKAAIEKALSE